jgi:hypothetical protein
MKQTKTNFESFIVIEVLIMAIFDRYFIPRSPKKARSKMGLKYTLKQVKALFKKQLSPGRRISA